MAMRHATQIPFARSAGLNPGVSGARRRGRTTPWFPLALRRFQAADGLGGKGDEAVGVRLLLLAQISHYRTHIETEALSIQPQ